MITIGGILISRGLDQTSDWSRERMNSSSMVSGSGFVVAYDVGPTLIRGKIVIKHVSQTEAENLRAWLVGTAKFSLNEFTITPTIDDDLGAGYGEAITVNYDGQPSTSGIIFPTGAGGKYEINLPYVYRVDDDGGAPDEEVES